MSRNELIAKIEALNEWEAMMEEAKTEADAIRSSIKAEMEERGVEELQAGPLDNWASFLAWAIFIIIPLIVTVLLCISSTHENDNDSKKN